MDGNVGGRTTETNDNLGIAPSWRFDDLLGLWRRTRRTIRPLRWIVALAAISAAFLIFVVRPTQPAPIEDSVDAAWNESIGRLGVWPIYPPEEDVYVGDLWAILLTDERDEKHPDANHVGKKPILATAARVGHIDLGPLLREEAARRVRFVEGNGHRGGLGAFTSDGGTPVAGSELGISPTIVAFPGVSIVHGRKASTSFASDWFGWGASNENAFTDEIHLTDTSTYGVALGEAFGTLIRWCSANGLAICSDAYARRVLAQTGITGTLDPTLDGSAYKNPIELRLVTRVFLARTIAQKSLTTGDRGVSARAALEARSARSPQPNASAPLAADPKTVAGLEQALTVASSSTTSGTSVLSVQSDGSMVEMKSTTYERPVVFGYRAASMLLTSGMIERN